MNKKIFNAVTGLITGAANGFFGSGGGKIAVPMLKKSGLDVKKAHATSLALTLPLSVISAFMYARAVEFDWKSVLMLIPFGLGGALIGTKLMGIISSRWLSVIFGILLIFAGGRNLLL